jgi:hypothetical protein
MIYIYIYIYLSICFAGVAFNIMLHNHIDTSFEKGRRVMFDFQNVIAESISPLQGILDMEQEGISAEDDIGMNLNHFDFIDNGLPVTCSTPSIALYCVAHMIYYYEASTPSHQKGQGKLLGFFDDFNLQFGTLDSGRWGSVKVFVQSSPLTSPLFHSGLRTMFTVA